MLEAHEQINIRSVPIGRALKMDVSMLNGIIGNQVRYLSDPVTVIGSLPADAIESERI